MKPTYLPVLGAIAAVVMTSACASSSSPRSISAGGTTGESARNAKPLAEVEQNDETGIDQWAAEEREKVLLQAREYVDFRQKKRLSIAQRQAILDDCAKDESTNPFCSFMLESSGRLSKRSRERAHRWSVTLPGLLKQLKTGHFDGPGDIQIRDITRMVKKVSSVTRLDPIFDELLNYSSCLPSGLYAGFALKAEEAFPEEKYRSVALSLFKKATECGDDSAAIQASYRLGLLLIWEERYAEAEKALIRLGEHPEGDMLRSRAMYWRFRIAQKMGNKSLAEDLRDSLVREYPLSIHGLLVGKRGEAMEDFEIVSPHSPWVQFRSDKKSELNSIVVAGEALQKIGQVGYSDRVLGTLLEQVEETEPGFQLYVAILFKRNGATINKFQLLAQMFRRDPRMISQKTLEMLYPLSVLEILQIYEDKIDPYVVMSLIRQESAFNARARSPAGAMGLMQVMPRTASRYARLSHGQLYDPQINVKIGVAFFSKLLERYDGDVELALAAYNCGPLRVDGWMKRYPIADRMLFLDLMPIRETREYVASIARNYYWYLRLYRRDELKEKLSGKGGGSNPPVARPVYFSLFGSRT